MRRQLNNGIPIQLALGETKAIFDANDFDPSYVYLVTLDAWLPPGVESSLLLAAVTSGVPASMGVFSSFPATNNGFNARRRNTIGPARILERFAVRGDQLIAASNVFIEEATIFLWGHFERAGLAPIPAPFRPLQPTNNLEPPFNAVITSFTVAPGNTVTRTLHLFDTQEERLDYVWLSLFAAYGEVDDVPAGETATLKFAGVDVPLHIWNQTVPTGFADTFWSVPALDFFDGLPLLAQGNDDKIEIEIAVPALGSAVNFYADGRFFRS